MDYLLDTNVVARCMYPAHPHHPMVVRAITTLTARGDNLFITAQVLRGRLKSPNPRPHAGS